MTQTVEAVFEHGLLRPLQPLGLDEGQRVSINVAPVPLTVEEMARLADRVYAGLSDEEIDEVEASALDRSNFIRPLRGD